MALARPYCCGTLETQDLKIVICRKTLETQGLKILICSETLETQDLKIFDSRKTLETQDLTIWICGETLETQNPEPQNFDVPRLKSPWTLTIQYRISCRALCQGVQQVMNSDDRTPKT